MQLCNAMLRRGEDVQHVIPMFDITPAEILVLRHVHGPTAVVDLVPTKMDKRSHEAEWDRLQQKYDPQAGSFSDKHDEDYKSVMERLFPGAMKKLPISLAEIGLGDLMNPHKRRGRPTEATSNDDSTETSGEAPGGEESGDGAEGEREDA